MKDLPPDVVEALYGIAHNTSSLFHTSGCRHVSQCRRVLLDHGYDVKPLGPGNKIGNYLANSAKPRPGAKYRSAKVYNIEEGRWDNPIHDPTTDTWSYPEPPLKEPTREDR